MSYFKMHEIGMLFPWHLNIFPLSYHISVLFETKIRNIASKGRRVKTRTKVNFDLTKELSWTIKAVFSKIAGIKLIKIRL